MTITSSNHADADVLIEIDAAEAELIAQEEHLECAREGAAERRMRARWDAPHRAYERWLRRQGRIA